MHDDLVAPDGTQGAKQFKTKRGRPSKAKAAEGGEATPKQAKKKTPKNSPNKEKATPATTASAMHRQEARK